ncbi:DNA-binding transcriptional MerR regulator [Amnibacterium kyonggiense]|uniref:DNA-binding transcriptional MerR regulator n=1 Tax=Amnibacterium kyonggiense TaxID=595671 RepID=A0A4R7FI03_9MICO|nr:DNA-binding transcriptional MerR regulator [Amnibacterium kyonggiense]
MWTIVEVARASGVTSRTLRHYDAIGLLPPAGTGANGYRLYGQEELLRLQQLLVLRELGLPLEEIRAVLDAQRDRIGALRRHHERLVAERDRLTVVAATVARTIADLEEHEGRTTMTMDRPENLFEGFDHGRYAEEARERWPEEAASSERYAASMSAEEIATRQREWTAQMVRMAELRAAGASPSDARVQAEIQAVHDGILPMWTPNAAAFRGLGATYVDDARFAETFDRVSPGLGAFYRDAMTVFADTRLT